MTSRTHRCVSDRLLWVSQGHQGPRDPSRVPTLPTVRLRPKARGRNQGPVSACPWALGQWGHGWP